MGSATARITEADFLTPPEFAGFPTPLRPTGQVGGARLEYAFAAGRTRLTEVYHQIPMRVLPPFHFPGEPDCSAAIGTSSR